MDNITQILKEHYSESYAKHGATPAGVDWKNQSELELRYEQMLGVAKGEKSGFSLLDVGCGYAGLCDYAASKDIRVDYSGIDVVGESIRHAVQKRPECKFYNADIFEFAPDCTYDYVVCNGILTQKLTASIADMEDFARRLIGKMFALCNNGIAFNLMTTKVNFMADNLYYCNPVEMFAYILANISKKVSIDHSYPLYEYTVYAYK